MKTFRIKGTLNDDMFKEFIDFTNTNGDDEWTIILDSGGGSESMAQILSSILNAKGKLCTVIASRINSAAFTLFSTTDKCNRKMVSGCLGMTHISYVSIEMDTRGKISFLCDKALMKTMKKTFYKEEVAAAEKFLTPKKLKKFKKGDDIYFTFEQLKKIFPTVEIIK